MGKNKISKYLKFIAVITLITILFTIIQNSYDNLMKSQKDLEQNILIKPFDLSIDTEIINMIEKRPLFDSSSP